MGRPYKQTEPFSRQGIRLKAVISSECTGIGEPSGYVTEWGSLLSPREKSVPSGRGPRALGSRAPLPGRSQQLHKKSESLRGGRSGRFCKVASGNRQICR